VNLSKIKEPVEEELKTFQKRFSSELSSKVALIDLITKYILKQKGKKVRPMLVLLCAKMCGQINDRTYTAAIMIELLHTATLIHDDVVDNAKTRRGLASINAVWKSKVAVLMGDFLLSKGLLVSLDKNEFGFLKITSEAVKKMSEGELLQIQKARNFDATEETYFQVIKNKTASLFQACCVLGGSSVVNNKDELNALSSFGENLGIAFQLRDDLLDYTGRKKLLGKSTGNDLKEKKFTLPLIKALETAPKKESSHIMKLIKNERESNFETVFDFINNHGGLDYTIDKINEYSIKAIRQLERFPTSESKSSLKKLVSFISDREY
jgi:Geranylgeranyl pyrophosphate synthase